MRILLINPRTPDVISNKEYYVPPSLLYLAAALRKNRFTVNILDLNTCKPQPGEDTDVLCHRLVTGRVKDLAPSLVGITCLFSGHFPQVWSYSRSIKEECPDLPVVIGGLHPTIFHKQILSGCPSIDYVVLGEGEVSLSLLAAALRDGELSSRLKAIDGLAFRWNGKVAVNPKSSFIENLDDLPMPAYDMIKLEDYYHDTSNWHNPRNLPINASIPILSSRACPRSCNFCSMFMVMGKKWRSRSPLNLIKEIEYLYHEHGHRHFSFMDDNLTLNKAHVTEICNQIVKRNLNIQFETPNGVATGMLDEEVMAALVAAGLVRISLAIESGSDHIRNKIMGKGLSKEKIYRTVEICKKHSDLYIRAFFLIGMPEDTPATLDETYDMIRAIDIHKPCVTNLMPFPGTRIFEQALQDNLFVNSLDVENIWRKDFFYYTGNKQFFIKPYQMTLQQLQEYRTKFDLLCEDIAKRGAPERMVSVNAA
ncbi:MAG: radical SAM protein [Syntrophobacteraceae bacterium]